MIEAQCFVPGILLASALMHRECASCFLQQKGLVVWCFVHLLSSTVTLLVPCTGAKSACDKLTLLLWSVERA